MTRRDPCCGEVSSLPLSIDEPLSPELVLVCPELAERARQLLPEPGSFGASSRGSRLQTLVLGFFAIALTVTPLAFVLAVLPARG
jgi:hypothetical protein